MSFTTVSRSPQTQFMFSQLPLTLAQKLDSTAQELLLAVNNICTHIYEDVGSSSSKLIRIIQ